MFAPMICPSMTCCARSRPACAPRRSSPSRYIGDPGGIIRLLGDRLVQEIRITREGSWDAFGGQYVVSSSLGPEVRTRSVDDFVSHFFRVTNFLLPWSFLQGGEADSASPTYMMVRLQVRPMKLVSALAILSFLRLEKEISSDWERIPIPEGDPKPSNAGAGR